MNPRPRHPGFTLIELLLAMSMVSMIAVAVYACFATAFQARDRATAAVASVRSAQASFDLIRQDLESALPPTGIMAGPFIGEIDHVEFHCVGRGTHQAGGLSTPGMQKIQLALATPGASIDNALVRRVMTNLLASVTVDPEDEIICRGVRALEIRYFDGYDWLETWDSALQGDVVPLAVQMTLEVHDKGRPHDPDAVYRVTRVFTLSCYRDPQIQEGVP